MPGPSLRLSSGGKWTRLSSLPFAAHGAPSSVAGDLDLRREHIRREMDGEITRSLSAQRLTGLALRAESSLNPACLRSHELCSYGATPVAAELWEGSHKWDAIGDLLSN